VVRNIRDIGRVFGEDTKGRENGNILVVSLR